MNRSLAKSTKPGSALVILALVLAGCADRSAEAENAASRAEAAAKRAEAEADRAVQAAKSINTTTANAAPEPEPEPMPEDPAE